MSSKENNFYITINTVGVPKESYMLVKTYIIRAIKKLIEDDGYQDSFFNNKAINYDNEQVVAMFDAVAYYVIKHTLSPNSVFNEMEDVPLSPQQLWDELYDYCVNYHVEYEFVLEFAEDMVPLMENINGAFK